MVSTTVRPKLVGLAVLLTACVALIAGASAAAGLSATASTSTSPSTSRSLSSSAANTVLDEFDRQMLDLMNVERSRVGAPPLAASTGLRNLALSWSTNMANGGTGGVLQHNPNVRAQLPSFGAANATAWAENVATWSPGNGRDAASVLTLYMNSPGHRANILNPAMRYVGIGTVISSSNVGWNTQNFTNKVEAVAPAAPFGHLDSATLVGSAVSIGGWAVDPAAPGVSIPVHVYVNAAATAVPTSVTRPDVNAALGVSGTHGFAATVGVPVGSNVVCVYAISASGGGNPSLGCVTVVRPAAAAPFGHLDGATVVGSKVSVGGWAVDPAAPSVSIPVHVYVNATGTAVPTSVARPDVNAAVGISGKHGFVASVDLPVGSNVVCAYAISASDGGNPSLGCVTVVRPAPAAPFGHLDGAAVVGSKVSVGGWAVDPAAPDVSIPVHVYVNAAGTALPTSVIRADVNAAVGVTGKHGFSAQLPLPPGVSNVCAYGISASGGPNSDLGCIQVSRS